MSSARVVLPNQQGQMSAAAVDTMKSTWTAGDYGARKFAVGVPANWRSMTLAKADLLVKPVPKALPDTFDARLAWPQCANVIGNIRDQSQCGSCWAVAAASTFSDRACIATNGTSQTSYSGLDTLSCCRFNLECFEDSGCNGGMPIDAWRWFEFVGVVTGGNFTNKIGCKPYPFSPNATSPEKTPMCEKQCQTDYNKHTYAEDKLKAKSSFRIGRQQEQIMTHLTQEGPVEAAFDVYDDFFNYKSGVYQHMSGSLAGGHAVKIIGWGTENSTPYWLVANSWGLDWGLTGYFKILRGKDECGIEQGIVAGMV